MPITLTDDERRRVVVDRIDALTVGEEMEVDGGAVRRVRRHEYVLHADNNKSRARWGTLQEIREDVTTFLVTGSLPPTNGAPW